MKRFTLLMTLVIILVAGTVTANEWKTPGADPTLVSWTLAIPQLKNCPIDPDRMVNAVQTNHGTPIWVKRGEYFSEMTGGTKLYQHEFAAFEDSIVAYSWRFINTNSAGWIELVIFSKCGNAAWRFVPPCPEHDTDSTAVIGVTEAGNKDEGGGFPWWILGLLGLLGLFGLKRRVGPRGLDGRDGQDGRDGRVLYVDQDGSTSETKQVPTPIDTITIPAEEPEKLTQLQNLREELVQKQREVTETERKVTSLEADIQGILDDKVEEDIDPTR